MLKSDLTPEQRQLHKTARRFARGGDHAGGTLDVAAVPTSPHDDDSPTISPARAPADADGGRRARERARQSAGATRYLQSSRHAAELPRYDSRVRARVHRVSRRPQSRARARDVAGARTRRAHTRPECHPTDRPAGARRPGSRPALGGTGPHRASAARGGPGRRRVRAGPSAAELDDPGDRDHHRAHRRGAAGRRVPVQR